MNALGLSYETSGPLCPRSTGIPSTTQPGFLFDPALHIFILCQQTRTYMACNFSHFMSKKQFCTILLINDRSPLLLNMIRDQ